MQVSKIRQCQLLCICWPQGTAQYNCFEVHWLINQPCTPQGREHLHAALYGSMWAAPLTLSRPELWSRQPHPAVHRMLLAACMQLLTELACVSRHPEGQRGRCGPSPDPLQPGAPA